MSADRRESAQKKEVAILKNGLILGHSMVGRNEIAYPRLGRRKLQMNKNEKRDITKSKKNARVPFSSTRREVFEEGAKGSRFCGEV